MSAVYRRLHDNDTKGPDPALSVFRQMPLSPSAVQDLQVNRTAAIVVSDFESIHAAGAGDAETMAFAPVDCLQAFCDLIGLAFFVRVDA